MQTWSQLLVDNAICMATDTVGPQGRDFKAIDLEKLKDIVSRHAY